MTLDIAIPTARALFAEFDGKGERIAGSPGFLEEGLSAVEAFLESFDTVDGAPGTSGRLREAAARWRQPGLVLEVSSPEGERTLASFPTAAGGLTLTATAVAPKPEGPLAMAGIDHNPIPICVHDPATGEFLFQNSRTLFLFEADDAAEAPDITVDDIIQDKDQYRRFIDELRSRGRIEKYRMLARTAKGREVWIAVSATLIHHEGREVVVSAIEAVTNFEDSQAELRRSQDLLNDALRSLSEGFALFDEDGRLIVANDRFRDINAGIVEFISQGVHWETMLREMARRRIALHAAGRQNAWIAEVLRATDSFETFEIVRVDGAAIQVVSQPTSLGGFIISETDITARREAERSARESDQMLSTILEASPANLCMSRIGDGEIIYRSPSCVALFGRNSSARDQFADPLDRADFLTDLLPGGRIDDFAADACNAAGDIFPALFSARVIEYRGEDVIVSTVTDLTEPKKAEIAIRAASARLRDAIEAMTEGFVLFDADERLVIANQRYLSMNAPYADKVKPGARLRDILVAGRDTGHLIDGDYWLEKYDEETAAGMRDIRRMSEFQLADGSHITSLRRPTRDGGIVCSWLDVTEQKRAAAELSRLNELLRDAIESLDEGFALYDSEDRLVMWNRRYEEMNAHVGDILQVGVTYDEILDSGLRSGTLPTDEVERVRERRMRGDGRRRFEFRHRDGKWFAVSRNPTSDDGFVITRSDITERKMAEHAEREADELLRRVLEACPVNLIMCRYDDGRVTYVSQNAAEIFGKHEQVSDYWADKKAGLKLTADIATAGVLDQRVFDLIGVDGETVPVALSTRKIDFRGEPMVVSQAFDLTERIEMEEELGRQQEMLHQSEKLSALGELLAGVAHELNNPLSVVVGHSLMLQEEVEDPALVKRTERISAAAERCARIVKTFLAMARQRPAKLELTSINSVIETALDVAGYGLRSAGVTIDTQLADDLPPVKADADQLAQVFANLIVNAENVLARKGAEGKLTLTTRMGRGGKNVVIEVADNGPGIPEAIRARIFEPFFTTKDVGEGTGIGLAFCHRIVEAHNGQISVSAAPGGGAMFAIRLAARRAEAPTEEPEEAEQSGRGAVLVIDDEPDVAELIAHILKRDGYKVATAASAEAALKLLPGAFDLILSDLNMPGMGGRAFLAEVRERWPDLEDRIGFITGDAMSPGAERFLELAGRPYLEKPVVPNDLRGLAASMTPER